MIEWVDDLHQHFVAPAAVIDGRYRAPVVPGASTEMCRASIEWFTYPGGPAWVAVTSC